MRHPTCARALLALVTPLFLTTLGCPPPTDPALPGGTSTGNGLVVAAHSSTDPESATPSGEDAQGTTFVLEEASAYVRHIGLHLPSDLDCADVQEGLAPGIVCDVDAVSGEQEVRVVGPFVVDLLARTTTPALTDVELPALTYPRVDVRFEPGRPEDGLIDEVHPLNDITLTARGSFMYLGLARTFEFGLSFSEEARFESADGITLATDAPSMVLLLLDVVHWFATLPITLCLDDGELVLDVNHLLIADAGGQSCGALEDALRTAIGASGELQQE